METLLSYDRKLMPLIEYLDSLKGRPDLDELKSHLESAEVGIEDLGDFVRFNEDGYRRNMVFESEVVELLCLCWRSGQRSPIHDHARSICGVKIVEGSGTETVYEMTPSGYIKAVGSAEYESGCVMVSEDDDTHQVANLEVPGKDLVTLHVYSPPLRKMKTYSVESRKTRTYEPTNEWLMDGGGI